MIAKVKEETLESVEIAIKKLSKSQLKWYCPERAKLIDKYKEKKLKLIVKN